MENPKLKVKKEPTIIKWLWCDKEQHRQHQAICLKCKNKKCDQYQKMAFKVYIDPPFGIKNDPPVDTSVEHFDRIIKKRNP